MGSPNPEGCIEFRTCLLFWDSGFPIFNIAIKFPFKLLNCSRHIIYSFATILSKLLTFSESSVYSQFFLKHHSGISLLFRIYFQIVPKWDVFPNFKQECWKAWKSWKSTFGQGHIWLKKMFGLCKSILLTD